MSGIAGQIRNQVTLYMSTQDQAGNYFPRIESITDTFGHRFDGPLEVVVYGQGVQTDQTLHPGQVISFSCIGVDPQGRDLKFSFRFPSGAASEAISASGVPLDIEWLVAEADINIDAKVFINLRADGATYHRFGESDQAVLFYYRVLPKPV